MKRYALRCDFCGVFHKVQVDGDDLQADSAALIIYQIEDDRMISYEAVRDVQQLNTSTTEEPDAARDQGETERPV